MAIFREYPKLLYNADGRQQVVRTLDEETVYTAAGWVLIPTTITPGIRLVAASTNVGSAAAVWCPPNLKRRFLMFVNNSSAQAHFKYAAGCAPLDFSWVLDPGERWEMPMYVVDGKSKPIYDGLITGYHDTQAGGVLVTELEFA